MTKRVCWAMVLLLAVTACGRRQPPPPPPVANVTTPPPEEPPRERSYVRAGFKVTLPPGWRETPAPAELERDGKGSAVAFRQGEGDLPKVYVTGLDKVAYTRWQSGHLEASPPDRLKILAHELKESLLGGDTDTRKVAVTGERTWVGRGIRTAWRMRFRGVAMGRPQWGDLLVAEDFKGGVFIVMLAADDEPRLEQALKVLDTMSFYTPAGPPRATPPVGGGLTSPLPGLAGTKLPPAAKKGKAPDAKLPRP